jgi:hypothetical protein
VDYLTFFRIKPNSISSLSIAETIDALEVHENQPVSAYLHSDGNARNPCEDMKKWGSEARRQHSTAINPNGASFKDERLRIFLMETGVL